jgi:PadR family transcriptional regulator PadR
MYERNILLGFIRIHILHHALEDQGIYGAEMINELSRHGYTISPGTLYPILHDMKEKGLLDTQSITVKGKIRKMYTTTPKGQDTLCKLKQFIRELSQEVL